MKFSLFVLLVTYSFIHLTFSYRGLHQIDFELCEQDKYYDGIPKNVEECNNRWPLIGFTDAKDEVGDPIPGREAVYPDYSCCYVQYKDGERTRRRCSIVQDSKTGRKKYMENVLDRFDDVKIICATNYYKLEATILLFFFLLL